MFLNTQSGTTASPSTQLLRSAGLARSARRVLHQAIQDQDIQLCPGAYVFEFPSTQKSTTRAARESRLRAPSYAFVGLIPDSQLTERCAGNAASFRTTTTPFPPPFSRFLPQNYTPSHGLEICGAFPDLRSEFGRVFRKFAAGRQTLPSTRKDATRRRQLGFEHMEAPRSGADIEYTTYRRLRAKFSGKLPPAGTTHLRRARMR
ncbi:hypothetical protein C8R46DRAFT_682564 [Mycena filopes]|nr:hypothetical protein C8R46DRAFT_682564 [Mycena filopes]